MSNLFRLSNGNTPPTEPEFTFQPPFASEYDEVSTRSIRHLSIPLKLKFGLCFKLVLTDREGQIPSAALLLIGVSPCWRHGDSESTLGTGPTIFQQSKKMVEEQRVGRGRARVTVGLLDPHPTE